MKRAPVVRIVAKPFVLPVFDDRWKAKCKSCAHFAKPQVLADHATMYCMAAQPKTRAAQHKTSCGEARETTHGGRCGPNALLWEPRK